MAQKRSEPRYMCADLVNILIHHEDRTVQEAMANLEDISHSGRLGCQPVRTGAPAARGDRPGPSGLTRWSQFRVKVPAALADPKRLLATDERGQTRRSNCVFVCPRSSVFIRG